MQGFPFPNEGVENHLKRSIATIDFLCVVLCGLGWVEQSKRRKKKKIEFNLIGVCNSNKEIEFNSIGMYYIFDNTTNIKIKLQIKIQT